MRNAKHIHIHRAGLKPMQLHWAPCLGVWVAYSFFPDTPCAWEFSRNDM